MNNIGILITSHGKMCQEMLMSAYMIVGKQEDIYTICLTDEGIQAYKMQFTKLMDDMCVKYDEIIILADIKNATPYNTGLMYLADHPMNKITLISGVNLAIVIEIIMSRQYSENLSEIISETIRLGKESIDAIDYKLLVSN